MANKLVPTDEDMGAVERYVDMSDGSFAKRVVATPGTGYPVGATPIHASASGAAANVTATLAAAVGKTTYITRLVVSGGGATAATIAGVVVAGLVGGSQSSVIGVPAGVNNAVAPLILKFDPPIPASAVNTAITVTANSFGAGNLNSNVEAFGYQL